MKRFVATLVYLGIYFARSSIGIRVVSPLDGSVVSESVKVIEGYRLSLNCVDDKNRDSIKWFYRVGGQYIEWQTGSSLIIEQFQRSDAGYIKCVAFDLGPDNITSPDDQSVTIYVDVLYKPETPDILGPQSAVKYDDVELYCSAQSNPSPTYYWTMENNFNALKIATGNTFNKPELLEDLTVYCWAETVMKIDRNTAVYSRSYREITVRLDATATPTCPVYCQTTTTDAGDSGSCPTAAECSSEDNAVLSGTTAGGWGLGVLSTVAIFVLRRRLRKKLYPKDDLRGVQMSTGLASRVTTINELSKDVHDRSNISEDSRKFRLSHVYDQPISATNNQYMELNAKRFSQREGYLSLQRDARGRFSSETAVSRIGEGNENRFTPSGYLAPQRVPQREGYLSLQRDARGRFSSETAVSRIGEGNVNRFTPSGYLAPQNQTDSKTHKLPLRVPKRNGNGPIFERHWEHSKTARTNEPRGYITAL